jgi:hypothetical protein
VEPKECTVMVGFNDRSAGNDAKELTKRLNFFGIPTFCTADYFSNDRAGEDWQKATYKGVDTCQYFVALMTKGWQESFECQDEAKAIYQRFEDKKDKGVIFLPVVYKDYSKEHEVKTKQQWTEMKLKTIQTVFKKDKEDDKWMGEIVNSINNSMSGMYFQSSK